MIAFENTERVAMPPVEIPLLRRWLGEVARRHGFDCGDLSYRFCNDEEILDANRQFLGHDYFTDIITFDYSREDIIAGDMLISLDTVRSNAKIIGATPWRELHRVIVHGLLHLCGINDKGPGEREVMERHEDEALRLLDEMGYQERVMP